MHLFLMTGSVHSSNQMQGF